MAIIRPGPTIGAITGNLAGLNFVLGKSSPFVRLRSSPVKKFSPGSADVRIRFATAVQDWKQMSESLRLEWNNAAALMTWTNRLGTHRPITGVLLHHKFFLSHRANGVQNLRPPVNLTRAPTLANLQVVSSAPNIITATWDLTPPFTDELIAWWGMRSFSLGPRAWYGRWTFLAQIAPTTPFTSEVLTTEFNDALGEPETGEQFAIKGGIIPGTHFAGPHAFNSTTSV